MDFKIEINREVGVDIENIKCRKEQATGRMDSSVDVKCTRILAQSAKIQTQGERGLVNGEKALLKRGLKCLALQLHSADLNPFETKAITTLLCAWFSAHQRNCAPSTSLLRCTEPEHCDTWIKRTFTERNGKLVEIKQISACSVHGTLQTHELT